MPTTPPSKSLEDWSLNYQDDPDGRKARVKHIQAFCDYWKTTPEDLLSEAEKAKPGRPPELIVNRILRFLHHLQEEGYAMSSITTIFRHIRSFFMWHNLFLPRLLWRSRAFPDYEDTMEVKLTQPQVKRMLSKTRKPQHRAVIAFLAQTGQREGILTAIKWDDIETKKKRFAIAKVREPYPNRKGINQNKIRSPFKFVIGPDALKLMKKLPSQDGGWVFKISDRHIVRVVEEAAERIGIQRVDERRLAFGGTKGKWHRIHPHVFRGYWKSRMRKGDADDNLVDYMMGHRNRYGWTYDRFSERELLNTYRKAEQYLRVV